MMFGYSGQILWVNLSNRSIRLESTADWTNWIGGRGLGAVLVSRSQNFYHHDMAEQPIAISAGPLVASGFPMGCRTAVTARNIISGGFCYSNVGGDFGNRMKMAGFDAIIIEGHSSTPVYLLLENNDINFIEAGELWGSRISDINTFLARKYVKDFSFMGIGPAGENQVTISCLIVDQAHAAGWGGSGAIFGAKNLKAIVAVGSHYPKVFNAEGLVAKTHQLEWRINASEAMSFMVRGGTHGAAAAGGYSGLVPTAVNNIRDEYLSPEESRPLREEELRQWETGRVGCLGCSIRCLHTYDIASQQYGSLQGEGMHANSVRGLGSNLGINKADDLFALHKLCNECGLDVDGVSSSIAFALECAEKEIISKEQPDQIILEWGNGPALIKLTEQISSKTGLGQILGKGAYLASQEIGLDSEASALTTKKVGINEQGIRSHRAWALGMMVSTRGGGHLGGSPQTENRRISPEVGQRTLANPLAGDPASYAGKGRLSAKTEVLKAIVDSIGLCYFVYGWYDISLANIEELAEMIYLSTGYAYTSDELYTQGLRLCTLERALSYQLGGYSRKDDHLPDRFYNTSVASGPYKGAHLDKDQVNKMLTEYYETLGWNTTSGLPDPELLSKLDLNHILPTR